MFSIVTHIDGLNIHDPAQIPGLWNPCAVFVLCPNFGCFVARLQGLERLPSEGLGCRVSGAPTGLQGRQDSHCPHGEPAWVLQMGQGGLPADLRAIGTTLQLAHGPAAPD